MWEEAKVVISELSLHGTSAQPLQVVGHIFVSVPPSSPHIATLPPILLMFGLRHLLKYRSYSFTWCQICTALPAASGLDGLTQKKEIISSVFAELVITCLHCCDTECVHLYDTEYENAPIHPSCSLYLGLPLLGVMKKKDSILFCKL